MAYYSDVGLAMTKAGIDALKSKEVGQPEETRCGLKAYTGNNCVKYGYAKVHGRDAETQSEFWLWPSVIWDSSYPEIMFLESLLKELDDNEYYFIRIGEDCGDAEILGRYIANPFDLRLSRTIEFESEDTKTITE